MTKETNYIEKMEIEFDELQERRLELEKFLISDTISNLSSKETELLTDQKNIMDRYSDILIQRIMLAKELKNTNTVRSNTCCCER